jgi:hypothetical protein
LACEAGHQRDLLVGERPQFLAEDTEGTDQFALFEHRDGDERADPAYFDGGDAAWIPCGISRSPLNIGDMHRLFGARQLTKASLRSPNACWLKIFGKLRCYA